MAARQADPLRAAQIDGSARSSTDYSP